MPHRVIAVVTDELHGEESVREIFGHGNGDGVDVRVVVPAIEANALEHTLGDIDEPRRQAEERLDQVMQHLGGGNMQVRGEVGDPDPVQAAQDALLKAPADEVLFFDHCESQSQWYENGLLERAEEEIELPLRMVFVEHTDGQPDHVVKVEGKGSGTINPLAGKEFSGGAYVPGMTRADLAGMTAGIVGTIVVAVLAAAVAADSATKTGWAAVAILIAIGVALANLAHVVGLTLFEAIRYRGGFATFFRTLALVGTPLAIAINAAILIFA
jgi:hypothetical protein